MQQQEQVPCAQTTIVLDSVHCGAATAYWGMRRNRSWPMYKRCNSFTQQLASVMYLKLGHLEQAEAQVPSSGAQRIQLGYQLFSLVSNITWQQKHQII
jgi:hypothetical protein